MYKNLEDLPVDNKSLREAQQAVEQTPQEENVPESQESVVEAAPETQPETKPTQQEMNFRALREKAERLERERDEALKIAQEAAKYQQQQYQQPEPENDDDDSISESDLVEGKHFKKLRKELKDIKKTYNQYQQQTQLQLVEAQLRAQYPDFEKVVTKENMSDLRYAFPEIGKTIDSSSDWHAKAVTAYTMLKQLGIYKEDRFEKDRAKVVANVAKPKSVASLQSTGSPLDRANAYENGLTEDLKKTLLAEMRAAARGS